MPLALRFSHLPKKQKTAAARGVRKEATQTPQHTANVHEVTHYLQCLSFFCCFTEKCGAFGPTKYDRIFLFVYRMLPFLSCFTVLFETHTYPKYIDVLERGEIIVEA